MTDTYDFNDLKAPAEKIALHAIQSVLEGMVRTGFTPLPILMHTL